jgi:hypothetical protein
VKFIRVGLDRGRRRGRAMKRTTIKRRRKREKEGKKGKELN